MPINVKSMQANWCLGLNVVDLREALGLPPYDLRPPYRAPAYDTTKPAVNIQDLDHIGSPDVNMQ
ncbi:hypothetical protein PHMEG_0008340 [Phytophthora megakarya]|uniref:Uncharacterized protein n=1 Tax=Phytophthora megakarya TaxID=4795 RepID=A0A225WJ98_9STRA|nr:hypothetical protein PHMEG_0008340 [Phytophthora megakarya]